MCDNEVIFTPRQVMGKGKGIPGRESHFHDSLEATESKAVSLIEGLAYLETVRRRSDERRASKEGRGWDLSGLAVSLTEFRHYPRAPGRCLWVLS